MDKPAVVAPRNCVIRPPPKANVYCQPAGFVRPVNGGQYFPISVAYGRSVPSS